MFKSIRKDVDFDFYSRKDREGSCTQERAVPSSTLPRVLAQDLRKTGCIKEGRLYLLKFSYFSLVQSELFLRVRNLCK